MYIPLISGCWWLFHTIVIFWNVWFPLHARHFDVSGYNKYLHMTIIVTALILPLIPVGVAFGTGGYATTSLTPSLTTCIIRNTAVSFYAYVLPICLGFSVGITLNILSIWKLLKMRIHSKQVKSYNILYICSI